MSGTSHPSGAAPFSRETQRERERLSRIRRAERLERMRLQMETLECALAALRVDTNPHDYSEDVMRVRNYLRQASALQQQSKQLQYEQHELRNHLAAHEVIKHTMTRLLQEASADEWQWNAKRWQAITKLHFQPWTMAECETEIDAGFRAMNAFLYGKGIQSTGLSFLGWRDQRRIDSKTNTLQFSLYKTFRGHDLRRHMDQYWTIYQDPEEYSRIILGGKGRVSLNVLQRVAPHISIVRYVEQYPDLLMNAHFLYLNYRFETEGGFTQCLRSVQSPELQLATDGKSDVWTSNFFWFRWEVLDEGEDLTHANYRLTIGGSLTGDDTQYANRWLCEVLAAAVRAELWATGKQLLTCA